MEQLSSTGVAWRSSTSMIFWGVLALTVFGCVASFCEFFFGIFDATRSWMDLAFETSSTWDSQTKTEPFTPFYIIHGWLALWTRVFEALTIAGWIAYVIGLSNFRDAQSSDKGRWLTGSVYSACWLGLIGMACTFVGGFLGLFGLLFRFAGWVLNLISLFKFRGAFNRLNIEESWNSLARKGAGNLRSSYTLGIIIVFYPFIVFLVVLFLFIGSVSSFPDIANSLRDNGMTALVSMIGGSVAIFVFLALVAVVLWISQICYLLGGWCQIKNGSLSNDDNNKYVTDNSGLMTFGAIFGTIVLVGLVVWSCISPLTNRNAPDSISSNDVEDVSYPTESDYSESRVETGSTYPQVDEQLELNEKFETQDEYKADENNHNYKGTIDNKYEIEMTLTADGTDYTGEYFYTKNKRPIQLRGQLTEDDGHLVLEEYAGMNLIGRFAGTLSGRSYSGIWSSADGEKSFPFSVTKK